MWLLIRNIFGALEKKKKEMQYLGICIFQILQDDSDIYMDFKMCMSICISESSWNIWKIQGWGTHVYPWQIHVDVRQNQYNIVNLKNKIN